MQRLFLPGEIKDMPAILYIPLLTPCMESEKLAVSIDTIKGSFLVSLAQKGSILELAYVLI